MAELEGGCDAIQAVLDSPAASERAAAAKAQRQAVIDADDSPFAHTQRMLQSLSMRKLSEKKKMKRGSRWRSSIHE